MHGMLTAFAAAGLAQELAGEGYDVLYDHGGKAGHTNVGRVTVWYGDKPTTYTRLAFVDIAVAPTASERVACLVEIEETTDKPKLVLGDALATLTGDGIAFGKRPLHAGPWTTLVILVRGEMQPRLDYLAQQIETLRVHLTTGNAGIGRLVVEGFRNQAELEERLRRHVSGAIVHFAGHQE
jgi:hypothetical protein